MNTQSLISRLTVLIISLVAAALLAGCGGGGGSGGGGVGGALGGVAATGAPVDGIVYVTDSNGIEVNVPAEVDGSFSISVEGMTPPYLLRVIPNGGGDVLYSFASEKNITVNITPLTTLALYLAHNGDLEQLYAAWSENIDALNDGVIEAQQGIINANLDTLYGDYSIDATFYDFMNVAFTTDSTGIDGVLDALDIAIDFNSGNTTVLVYGELFAWEQNIDTSMINLGDFAIEEGSTWVFTVSDSINDIHFTEQALLSSVPNDLEQFEAVSQDGILADFQFEGLEININITSLTYDVTGSGEVGTAISGHLVGTVRINGEVDGQIVNETVNLNTVFEWERTDSVPA